MKILQVEQMQRVERLEAELGREQVRLRAMLSHLTTPALGYQVTVTVTVTGTHCSATSLHLLWDTRYLLGKGQYRYLYILLSSLHNSVLILLILLLCVILRLLCI